MYATSAESMFLSFLSTRAQVLYGVPREREEEAQALTRGISSGLRGVMGAIDAK